MRIGSLFAGIGGLELGLEWSGVGHVVWQVERDQFCLRVLARHWPGAERFEDVTTVGAHNLAPVDVIAGGFPCQDLSLAGKGTGLHGKRSGLFFDLARIVRELRPRFVVLENVAAILGRGAGDVLGTLASLGYDAGWSCIRASDVGAMHRRDRWFCIAWQRAADRGRERLQGSQQARTEAGATSRAGSVADSDRGGCEVEREPEHPGELGARRDESNGRSAGRRRKGTSGEPLGNAGRSEVQRRADGRSLPGTEGERAAERLQRQRGRHADCDASAARAGGGANAETQSGMGRSPDGLPVRLDVARPGEPQHPWEAPRTVTQAQDRVARLKALGNAVVPQVAEIVGRRLIAIAEREGLL